MRKREKFILIILSGLAYCVIDMPVQMTGVLPSFAGIKNFLPFTLGLFFGAYGVTGCILGCTASYFLAGLSMKAAFLECLSIAVTGLGMYYGWHILVKDGRIQFKIVADYARYIVLLIILSVCVSVINGSVAAGAAYFLVGLFLGVLVNILFSSLLHIEPVLPHGKKHPYDAEFCLLPYAESLEEANEIIEMSALQHGVKMKQVLEIQSCIEELSIRIRQVIEDAKISVSVQFGEAASARLHYEGRKYNPFRIEPSEDELDIMSLKIIKHRAIRASYRFIDGENMVHVVI